MRVQPWRGLCVFSKVRRWSILSKKPISEDGDLPLMWLAFFLCFNYPWPAGLAWHERTAVASLKPIASPFSISTRNAVSYGWGIWNSITFPHPPHLLILPSTGRISPHPPAWSIAGLRGLVFDQSILLLLLHYHAGIIIIIIITWPPLVKKISQIIPGFAIKRRPQQLGVKGRWKWQIRKVAIVFHITLTFKRTKPSLPLQ